MVGHVGLACFLQHREGNEHGPSVRVVHGSAQLVRVVRGVVDNQTLLLSSSRLPAAVAGCSNQEMPRTSNGAWSVPSARSTQDSSAQGQ